jgi:hypothetical protein
MARQRLGGQALHHRIPQLNVCCNDIESLYGRRMRERSSRGVVPAKAAISASTRVFDALWRPHQVGLVIKEVAEVG